jgi:putative transposase
VAWAAEAFRASTRQNAAGKACRATGAARSTVTYRARRPSQDALRRRLRELAQARVSYGYRRLHVLLRRDGWPVNLKRVRRRYREEGLSLVRRRPPRRKSAATRSVRTAPTAANQRRAMDFMGDALADGTRVRVFTLIDLFTRERLALDARPRFTGADVAAVLTRVGTARGLPPVIQCDQGTEFTPLVLDHWAHDHQVTLDFSRRARPGDNVLCEAFNGSVRRE